MKTRTWPYGTQRRASLLSSRPITGIFMHPSQVVSDERGEGHVLIGAACCDPVAKEGDTGTLTFTKGGPTGGYWKFTRDRVQAGDVRARFTIELLRRLPGLCFVVDCDGDVSVTNDAEAVVAFVAARYASHRIIYRDTERQWSELTHDGDKFTGFLPYTGPVPEK